MLVKIYIPKILPSLRYSIAGFIIFVLFSCKKFITVPPPDESIATELLFNDDKLANGAVTGVYSEMMRLSTQFTSASTTLYAGMCSDELTHFSSASIIRNEFIKNQISPSSHENPLSSQFWDKAYKYIYTANACLEGLEKSTGVSPNIKKELIGESYFIRAFCYFHLVNLFGDIPLALVTDYRETSILPRASTSAVYDQMILDLQKAEEGLSESYSNTDNLGRIRPNKWAATALLARVYLYKRDWLNAEIKANAVINAGIYSLPQNPADVFLKNSPEAIWQLMPVNPSNNTWEGNLILPSGTLGYIITDTLFHDFETGDQRKTNWLGLRKVGTDTFYYPAKYKVKTGANLTEYYMVLRLAEQYLIRAEARAHQNNITGAIADIDSIRHRAGLNGTAAITEQEVIAAIAHERRVELFVEWGHRWYDLKRTGKATEVLGTLKPTWTQSDSLWPIPMSQIRINTSWQQNPGY